MNDEPLNPRLESIVVFVSLSCVFVIVVHDTAFVSLPRRSARNHARLTGPSQRDQPAAAQTTR